MTDYFTSDWHLDHTAVIEFCNRPFRTVDKMNKALIRNTNNVVGPKDRLFILGDFCWLGPQNKEVIRRHINKINGRKILILGNHDRLHAMDYVEFGIESVHTSYVYDSYYPYGQILLAHDPSLSNVWPRNKYMFCGHVHDLFQMCGNVMNVGVDVWDYKPVSLHELLERYKVT